jgi:hypothetical protein
MKPRRENGATLVSPMTSGVGKVSALMGSALMAALLFWEAHSACKLARTQITCLRDAGRLFGEEGRTRRNGAKSGIKNKAVDAIYRQRPCQPRILKSAHAIR